MTRYKDTNEERTPHQHAATTTTMALLLNVVDLRATQPRQRLPHNTDKTITNAISHDDDSATCTQCACTTTPCICMLIADDALSNAHPMHPHNDPRRQQCNDLLQGIAPCIHMLTILSCIWHSHDDDAATCTQCAYMTTHDNDAATRPHTHIVALGDPWQVLGYPREKVGMPTWWPWDIHSMS
ncbi:hypothetical protein BU15DRAFT_63919 [Melanogaster broomeanus]|nr:hypothetical protein BU15DRAFT_63919 [Melanogaster broomeanus]